MQYKLEVYSNTQFRRAFRNSLINKNKNIESTISGILFSSICIVKSYIRL